VPLNPSLQTLETYEDRQIIAMPDFAGPLVSVLLASAQGELLAGRLLGKNSSSKYEKYAAAVKAALDTGVVADNNAITFTAVAAGSDGNVIKVQLLDPAGNSKALAVSISADTIVVSLATSAAGAITSTAAEVIAAVNAHLYAKTLLVAANKGASTGAGVVAAVAATALAGGANANVVPSVILEEYVANQVAEVTVRAYLGGVFYTSMLVGMDAAAIAALGARVVNDITIVPV